MDAGTAGDATGVLPPGWGDGLPAARGGLGMYDAVVVGGGIAGLMAAESLAASGASVVLLEASGRTGGLVRTVHRDGMVLEQGPQSLQATAPIGALVLRLGLGEQVVEASPSASRRYLLRDGGLKALPDGLGAVARTPLWSWASTLRLLAEPGVPRLDELPVDLRRFVVSRVGEGLTAAVLPAFVAGVFGGDPAALDAEASFPDLVEDAASGAGVLRGGIARARAQALARPLGAPRRLFSFRGGMEVLVTALTSALGPVVQTGQAVSAVVPVGGAWEVRTATSALSARQVVMAVEPEVAAQLLPGGDRLPALPRSPIAAVHLAWPAEAVTARLDGFGWLCGPEQRRDALGALWVSSVFPGHAPGRVLVRVMMGGTRDPDVGRQVRSVLVARARSVVGAVEGIDLPPEHSDVALHRVGIPQYPVGWARAVAGWQRSLPGVSLLGWGFAGIGLSHAARAALEVRR